MKCSNCGKKLNGNENFCRICGTPVVKEETEEKEEKIELTDNIDVSKIKLSSDNEVSADDTMDLELPDKEKNKELTAMIEITNASEEEKDIVASEPEKKKNLRLKNQIVQIKLKKYWSK